MVYIWGETKKMVVDILTKDKLDMLDMDNIVLRNNYEGLEKEKYKVVADDLEIKMEALTNCKLMLILMFSLHMSLCLDHKIVVWGNMIP